MKLWDKGFKTDEKIDIFTVGADRELDLLLAKYDVIASRAHAQMLASTGLITLKEGTLLTGELDRIEKEIDAGNFTIEDQFEDMHSKIEYLLIEELGDTGKKIHTARSRNDQVLVAMQLYLREEINSMKALTLDLFDILLNLAKTYQDVLMPGYTHLQVAMPSSFALWLGAYAESLADDMLMLNTAHRICDQNPLGSAAGYGSSFPIDREFTTEALGFATMKYNVVAAQMGRGKVEKHTAYAMAGLAGTLGKLAMDICLYLSQNFDFISFPKEFTTGSSIMPHKKNPDVFELIRGKCNKLQALPNTLAMLTTNLPSGYHRDLQLCKELIVPAIQEMKSCLEMTAFSIKEMKVNTNILEEEKYQYLFSVDTLNQMVLDGIPFREAYRQMGESIDKGTYTPHRDIHHTHTGSIGKPALQEIRNKMKRFSE
ncbi:argininosuccinate lyase [Robertkochia flava]|uniref:argininosuccinate lyase n=1 Tax=Robertkochia flava TaxID=3447986 RepID=UPI001CCD3654|nr:argininosuccinate lyase [Robertkochia marina]